MKDYPFTQIKELFDSAKNILICLPRKVSFDQVAAALSLYLSFGKTQKNVSIVAPEPMTVGFSHLVGVNKIKDKIVGTNLVLTIQTPIENIDKVSSKDDGKYLSLIIIPKNGASPITPEQISFTQAGNGFDLIFTIGARKLEELGKIYLENQETFNTKPIINIDNNSQNISFGTLNLVDLSASSCSEIVAFLISGLGLPTDGDIGSNLFLGLKEETKNFQSERVSAETFEAAAFSLRIGGSFKGMESKIGETKPGAPATEKPVEEKKPSPSQPPQEWLEPKIYKGSTIP